MSNHVSCSLWKNGLIICTIFDKNLTQLKQSFTIYMDSCVSLIDFFLHGTTISSVQTCVLRLFNIFNQEGARIIIRRYT